MFDLDKAIAEWRQQSMSAGIQNPLVLDELESHLRDDVEQQVRSGVSAQRAFDAATERIGQPGVLRAEFKKAEQAKPVIQRKVVWVLIGLAFLGCWIQFGQSPAVVFVYGMLLAGLIVATFIDVKSLVIPDAITIGGALAGLLCSSSCRACTSKRISPPACCTLTQDRREQEFHRLARALASVARAEFFNTGARRRLTPVCELSITPSRARKSPSQRKYC